MTRGKLGHGTVGAGLYTLAIHGKFMYQKHKADAARLSGRGIQTTGESTIVPSFHPPISFFIVRPLLPPPLSSLLTLSSSVSLLLPITRYNPGYCTPSHIMMLETKWEKSTAKKEERRGEIGAARRGGY